MIERRALDRIETNQLAILHVDGVCGVHPTMVVNIHDKGARLYSITFHIAAFQFDLTMDGFRTTKHCHVVWRDGNTCGIEFVARNFPRRQSCNYGVVRA